MYDPILFDRKAVYMQRTADFVRAGYRFWTAGEVPPERVRALVKKFAKLYGIDQTRHQRAHAKAKGEGCAVLLLYAPYAGMPARQTAVSGPQTASDTSHRASAAPQAALVVPHAAPDEPSTATLRWILLVTAGDHPAHQLEHLRDATEAAGRIVLTGYELIQLPRTGQSKPAWTWRMQDDTYQGWRLRLIAAARRHLPLVTAEVGQLARTPGFAGCRAQTKKLAQLVRGEWRRRNPSEPPLNIPRIGYVQRLPNSGSLLSVWMRRYTKQTRVLSTPEVSACQPDT